MGFSPGILDNSDVVAAIATLGGNATSVTSGRKAVASTNTPIVLGSATTKVIFITAFVGNSDLVVIGGSGVVYSPEGSRTGKILYPGDSITIAVDDLSRVYVNGTSGDGVTFSYTA